MIRIGIIGVGGIAGAHIGAYEKIPGQQIVALCDILPERASGRAEQVAMNIGNTGGTAVQAKAYTDYRELLADSEVDMVDICLPTYLHAEVTVAALAAGKHVLCEKPMALNVEQCDAMIAAAKANDRLLMIAQCIRFWPEYQILAELVRSERYGKVRSAIFQRRSAFPRWREWFGQPELSGGCLLDLHIHDTDFITYLFGMPQSVSSRGIEDQHGISHIGTEFEYGNEALITAEGSWHHHDKYPFSMTFLVRFEKATVAWGPMPLTIYRNGEEPCQPEVAEGNGYQHEIAYFLDCIARGVQPEIVTPWQARESVRLVLAEGQSVREKQTVTI